MINSSLINPSPKQSGLIYRPDIDGLRALAVLLVVGFHAFRLNGGYIGVDIFFVISGYLISTIILVNLYKSNFSFSHFYIRRIKRIFPALILVLLTCVLLGWFLLLPLEYEQLGKHLAGASIFISNFLLWQEAGYFDTAANAKPLLHLWSLGIEEQFYIIWPLLLWIGHKAKLNLVLLISILAIISFSLNIVGIHSSTVATFYSPQTRFWELACGSLLACLIFKQNYTSHIPRFKSSYQNIISFLGIIGIIYCILKLNKKIDFPGFWAIIPTFSAAFIIAAGDKAWFNRTILSHRILVSIGLISFPLYLWHWPLLVFVNLSMADKSFSHQAIKLLVVILSFVLAAITYRFIEKPMRFGQYSAIKVVSLLLFLFLSGFIGYKIYSNQGFYLRIPKLLQIMMQNNQPLTYSLKSCFLEKNQSYAQFGDCGLPKAKNKNSILIWGDSHAAHFYSGYKVKYGDSINLIIRTAAGCPPIINAKKYHTKECKEINEKIFQLALREKPDKVVLSAVWTNQDDWFNVSNTIKKLRSAGITDIDLIGPDPWWINGLPRQLFLYSRRNKKLPVRMHFGLRPYFFTLDKKMKIFADKEKVHYISLVNILCNQEGCLTYLPDKTLVSYDYGHFSEKGSSYVVSKFS